MVWKTEIKKMEKKMRNVIAIVGGYKAKIIEVGAVGFGVIYLEGPRKGWYDWVVGPNKVEIVEVSE